MSLDRETLAAQIYAAHYMKPSVREDYHICPKQAFRAADHFLKEAERQRKQPEPPKCEHNFVSKIGEFEREFKHCLKCGERHRREEPAPKRDDAREWWLYLGTNGRQYTVWQRLPEKYDPKEWVHVREVLND
jgi:hypothetical protein